MSVINVTVTNAGSTNVAVSNASTVNATVGNGGVVNVALGTISPGNATVVSGTLTINSTTTLAAGSSAFAKNVGTAFAASLDIGIPAGPATLVSVGNTTTLAAGSNATVNGTANGSNLTLAFGIPRGANGINGVTPSFAIGNVTTGAAGSSASVTATTTNSGANVTLDLTIPRGDPGTSGSNGTNGTSITLSNGTPANLGTASAGTSNLAARADHIHSLPVIAYGNLSGVPTNFPTNTTLVTGLNSSYSGINHGHNYVTSLNNLTGALTLAAGSNVTLTANGSTLTLSSAGGGISANDAVDGGDYVGEIINGILFSVQPQSQSLTSTTTLTLGSFTPQAQNGVPLGSSTLAASISGSDVASFGNKLLAVRSWDNGTLSSGRRSSIALATSSDNGVTWSQLLTLGIEVGATNYLRVGRVSIASNGTRSVVSHAVHFYDGPSAYPVESSVRYSDYSNLSNLTLAATALPPVQSVAYSTSASRWAALTSNLAFNGTGYVVQLHSSSDGNSWTQRANASGTGGVVVSCGNQLIAMPSGADPRVLRSSDGVSWTTSNVTFYATDAASNGSRVVVTGSTNTGYSGGFYSSDGVTWQNVTLPVACTKITHAAGLFMAWPTAANSTDLCTSPDGVSWTLRTISASTIIGGAASASGSSTIFFTGSGNTAFNAVLSTSAASANLAVSASVSGGAAVSYQWQSSTDAGSTWANVTNATTSTLSLTGLTTANSGTRYRAAASATGATTAFSQSATLTVSG